MSDFETALDLVIAVRAAKKRLAKLKPGEEAEIDIPDVAFKQGSVRFDVTELTVKRAEEA